MPYKNLSDLPENVRAHLPKDAQKIYLEAFNHAFVQYKEREDQETVSHKVAWTAVKTKYEKSESGNWQKKSRA